jgi:penicillin-binding protein 2
MRSKSRRGHSWVPSGVNEDTVLPLRRSFLIATGGVISGLLVSRMAWLQTLEGQRHTSAADENRFDVRILVAPRGVIYDRGGEPLAITSRDYRVSIVPERCPDPEATIRQIAAILGLEEPTIRRRLTELRSARRFDELPIRQGLTWPEFSELNVRLPSLPGVVVEAGSTRRYPFDVAFAHPIGYVQKPNQREIEAAQSRGSDGARRAQYLRHPDVRVGKAGLEAGLETALHGEAGWRKIEVNASGRVVSEIGHEVREPVPGQDVVLTLDGELQRAAMERMAGESAATVVMDIEQGDLVVLASSPGFDPNLFINGISAAAFSAYNTDEKKPLFHKCVTGAYKPGSTFKMVTGLAAMAAGMSPSERISCPGFFSFGGRRFHCWKRGGHGSVDYRSALKGSCNVYFYQAALRAGPDGVARMARLLGFDVAYDLDIPSVVKGNIPDPEWWRRVRGGEWPAGGTLNMGIGQGDVLTSPVQLATFTARLANGGKAVVPRLVRARAGLPEVGTPAPLGIDPVALQRTNEAMWAISNEAGGTAYNPSQLDLVRHKDTGRIVVETDAPPGSAKVQLAGKTGTAQVRVITAAERARGVRRNEDLEWRLRDHALFVCFGPYDQPRYACAVVVEHGGGGSRVAAPIARDVMRAVLLKDPANRPTMTIAAGPSTRVPT